MSRAFIRESDAAEPPDIPPLVSRLPPGVVDYLTPDGADRLRAELARLEESEHHAVAGSMSDDAGRGGYCSSRISVSIT